MFKDLKQKLVEILLSMMKTPKDDILESFIAKTKLMDSEKLKTTFCTVHSRHSTIESKTPEGRSATLESR